MRCCGIILGFAKTLPGDLKTETVVDVFCSQLATQAFFNGAQMAIRSNNSAVVPTGAHRKRSGELSGQAVSGPDAGGSVGRGSGRVEGPHVRMGGRGPVKRAVRVFETSTYSCLTHNMDDWQRVGAHVGAYKNTIPRVHQLIGAIKIFKQLDSV